MIKLANHSWRRVSLLQLILIASAVILLAFLFNYGNARALSASEWQTVATAIDDFIDAQYVSGENGEAGFLINATDLKTLLDSNGDNVYLGDGDDAAGAPVLVDVYGGSRIPGTSYLVSGSFANATNTTSAPAVALLVNNHRNAGFSYDIVPYCLTGHWGSLVMMDYGVMAHAGYFGSPVPSVKVLKWARLGWGGSTGAPNYNTYNKPYTATPVSTPGPYALATNTNCTGTTPDSELVRCTANTVGSAVGAGLNAWGSASDANYNPVDVRSTVDYYLANNSGNSYSYQVPLQALFDATGGTYDNLMKLNPGTAKQIVFYGRTQISGHMAARGARMLGYNSQALRFGIPMWSGLNPPNWEEKWVSNPGYPYTSSAIDTTAPTITVAPSAGNITANSADISRTANEPATMKVEYGTSPGVYTNTINNTVLNSSKSVTLNGLDEYTTYYVKVTSYDGQANGTASSEFSFTTADTTAPVVSNISPSGWINSASPTIEADLADSAGSGIDVATASIRLGSDPVLTACTVSTTHISCPSSGLADTNHTITVSVSDNSGNSSFGTGAFTVDATAPSISNLAPSDTIYTSATVLKANYADTGAGINSATARIYLDGASQSLTGCTVTGTAINCPVTGLAEGAHPFRVEVGDSAGNTASDNSGAFNISLLNYYYTWYDYGNTTTRLYLFDPGAGYTPSQAWLSCAGCWDFSRTKTAAADRDDDGRVELNVFYDYGNATGSLFIFDPALGYEPEWKWTSCAGCWDFSRSKVVSGADQLGAGLTELYVLYGYEGGNTGLFIFDPVTGEESRVWLSGAGNWDWSRTKVLTAADYDGDGAHELAVLYDYGNAATGIFIFDPGEWSNENYLPTRVWFSGPGGLEIAGAKVAVADQNNDGRGEIAVLYDYGHATTGILVFNPAQWSTPGYVPARPWLSGTGAMDWHRTGFLSGADQDGDGITELAILYNYGGGNTGILQIDPSANPAYTPGPVWLSGSGWDFSRTWPI